MYKLDQLATLLTKAGLAATPGGLAALAGQIASDPTVRATAKAAIQKVVPISDSGWDWLTSGNNGGQQQQQ
jgi:hypothetical protein